MYSIEHVAAACGASSAKYVTNKARGGRSGQKGTRYEDRFAVFKIAHSAQLAFENGNGSFAPSSNVTLYGQLPCFVDDLVIFRKTGRRVEHFQAKNCSSTNWGKGAKSLRADFRDQLKLSDSRKLKCSVTLVVSDKNAENKLRQTLPPELKGRGQVFYFPPYSKLLVLV